MEEGGTSKSWRLATWVWTILVGSSKFGYTCTRSEVRKMTAAFLVNFPGQKIKKNGDRSSTSEPHPLTGSPPVGVHCSGLRYFH